MKIVKDDKITFVTVKSKEGQEELARRKAEAEKIQKEKEAKVKK